MRDEVVAKPNTGWAGLFINWERLGGIHRAMCPASRGEGDNSLNIWLINGETIHQEKL